MTKSLNFLEHLDKAAIEATGAEPIKVRDEEHVPLNLRFDRGIQFGGWHPDGRVEPHQQAE